MCLTVADVDQSTADETVSVWRRFIQLLDELRVNSHSAHNIQPQVGLKQKTSLNEYHKTWCRRPKLSEWQCRRFNTESVELIKPVWPIRTVNKNTHSKAIVSSVSLQTVDTIIVFIHKQNAEPSWPGQDSILMVTYLSTNLFKVNYIWWCV